MGKLKKNMLTAAFFLSSAEEWRRAACLLENNKFRTIEICCLYSFSSELYIKALLIHCYCNYNKLTPSERHNLKELFELLPDNVKLSVKEHTDFSPLEPTHDDEWDCDIPGCSTFEDALSLVSNDFMRLRYACELFNEFKPFITYLEFNKNLNDSLSIISPKVVYNNSANNSIV